MARRIVIDLCGEEDILVTQRKKEAGGPRKQEWHAPAERLQELTYEELHETMPEAYRALFEEYFRK